MTSRRCVLAVLVLSLSLAMPASAIALARTSLTARLSATRCTYSAPAILKATFSLPYARVDLYRDGKKVASKKTDSGRRVQFEVGHYLEAKWQLRYPGSSKYASSKSVILTTRPRYAFHRDGTTRISGSGYLNSMQMYQIIVTGSDPQVTVKAGREVIYDDQPSGRGTWVGRFLAPYSTADRVYVKFLLEQPTGKPSRLLVY